jgi:hypothetical protein
VEGDNFGLFWETTPETWGNFLTHDFLPINQSTQAFERLSGLFEPEESLSRGI